MRHLDAVLARIWTLDAAQRELVLEASSGDATVRSTLTRPIGRAKIGKIAERGAPYLTNDFTERSAHRQSRVGAARGHRRVRRLSAPRRGNVVGVLAVYGGTVRPRHRQRARRRSPTRSPLGIERKLADEARRAAEPELRAQAEQLELINEIGKNLTSELEIAPLVQRVTNLATRLAQASVRRVLLRHRRHAS